MKARNLIAAAAISLGMMTEGNAKAQAQSEKPTVAGHEYHTSSVTTVPTTSDKLRETLSTLPVNLIVIGDSSGSYAMNSRAANLQKFDALMDTLRSDKDYLQAYILGMKPFKTKGDTQKFGGTGEEEFLVSTAGKRYFDAGVRDEVERKLERTLGQEGRVNGPHSDNLHVLEHVDTIIDKAAEQQLPVLAFFWDGEPNSADDIDWKGRYPDIAAQFPKTKDRLAEYHRRVRDQLLKLKKERGLLVYMFTPPNAVMPEYAYEVADKVIQATDGPGAIDDLTRQIKGIHVVDDMVKQITQTPDTPQAKKITELPQVRAVLDTPATPTQIQADTRVQLQDVHPQNPGNPEQPGSSSHWLELLGALALLAACYGVYRYEKSRAKESVPTDPYPAFMSTLQALKKNIPKNSRNTELLRLLDDLENAIRDLAKGDDVEQIRERLQSILEKIQRETGMNSNPHFAKVAEQLQTILDGLKAKDLPVAAAPQQATPEPAPAPQVEPDSLTKMSPVERLAREFRMTADDLRAGKPFRDLPKLTEGTDNLEIRNRAELTILYAAFFDLLESIHGCYQGLDETERQRLDPFYFFHTYKDINARLELQARHMGFKNTDLLYAKKSFPSAEEVGGIGSFGGVGHLFIRFDKEFPDGCVFWNSEHRMWCIRGKDRDYTVDRRDPKNRSQETDFILRLPYDGLTPFDHFYLGSYDPPDESHKGDASMYISPDVFLQFAIFNRSSEHQLEPPTLTLVKWNFAKGVSSHDIEHKPLAEDQGGPRDMRMVGNLEITSGIPLVRDGERFRGTEKVNPQILPRFCGGYAPDFGFQFSPKSTSRYLHLTPGEWGFDRVIKDGAKEGTKVIFNFDAENQKHSFHDLARMMEFVLGIARAHVQNTNNRTPGIEKEWKQ